MDTKTIYGLVERSRSEPRSGSQVIDATRIEIIPFNEVIQGNKIEVGGILEQLVGLTSGLSGLKMIIDGIHRINKGEKIRVAYETHTGVHWVKSYDILSGDEAIYSYGR